MTYNEPITRRSSTLDGRSIWLRPWNDCVISARVWTPGWTLTLVMWSSCTVRVGGVAWLSSSQPSWITATSAQGWFWLKTSATIQMLLLWTSAKCHCLLTYYWCLITWTAKWWKIKGTSYSVFIYNIWSDDMPVDNVR